MDNFHPERSQQDQPPLPEPSWFPLFVALGVVLVATGIVTLPYFSFAGVLLILVSVAGWVNQSRPNEEANREEAEALAEAEEDDTHE